MSLPIGNVLAGINQVHLPSPYFVRISRQRNVKNYTGELRDDGMYLVPAKESPGGSQDSAPQFETSDTSRENYHQLKLDFDRLPQPSVLGSIIGGVTQQTLRQRVLANASIITPVMLQYVGRPPTQEEMDLLADYTAQGIQTGSRGPFIGTVCGLAQQLRTARGGHWYLPLPFRFPFSYARGATFNPEIFKIAGRELLTGQAAYAAHKMMRMSLYAFAGYLVGRVYLNVNANGAAIRAGSDPKLAAAKKATDAMMNKHREEVMEQMGVKKPQSATARKAGSGDSAVFSRVPGAPGAGAAAGATVSDDASPTGGAGAWDDTGADPDAFREDKSAENALSSENAPGSDRFAEDKSARHPRQHQGSFEKLQRQTTTTPRQDGGSDDDFFTQTPTETRSQASSAPTPQPQPSGNAWDRLRRGGPSAAPRRSKPSAADDGQSPVARDEDEKSQAQKEFDAMLERERSGDEPKGGSRRW